MSETDATQLLVAWAEGDRDALDRLMPLVDDELRAIAGRLMRRERPDHTLQPTALVNEAVLKLLDVRRITWQSRAHFLAMAARLMRRILVDAARARRAEKRGSGNAAVALDDTLLDPATAAPDIVALHDAMTALATFDSRKSQVVELRFFGGLSVEEVADVLGISTDTVTRDWTFAKAWLRREITGKG